MSDSCCDLGSCLSPGFFKALGEPNRILILIHLAESGREMSVSEIAGCCSVNFSVVARHLKVLRDAGILDSEKRGKEVFYRVRYDDLVQVLRTLADAIDGCCGSGKDRVEGRG